MIRHLPNFLTCCNLAVGTFGVFHLVKFGTIHPLWFVGISALFDFLDGFAARMLRVKSELGKQLDSLSDLVSFGLLPTVYLMSMADVYWYPPILVSVFSAVRLAIFNLDDGQEDRFIGLPTPANAIMITSLSFSGIVFDDVLIGVVSAVSAFLLVAKVPMLALKFKSWGWKGNEFRWILILMIVLGMIVLKTVFIPFIIPFYIVLSLIDFLGSKFMNRNSV